MSTSKKKPRYDSYILPINSGELSFEQTSESVKESHLQHMLLHAPEIARVLNLEITNTPPVHTGKAQDQYVTLIDKSTRKIWYLFTLATLMSKKFYSQSGYAKSNFPNIIESHRKNIRNMNKKLAPNWQSFVTFDDFLEGSNAGLVGGKYLFGKKPFFLASKYGGILLNIKPVVRKINGMTTYKINLLSLGFYAHPETKNRLKSISPYGESNKEDFMKMVRFSQIQIPPPEWKLMDASKKNDVPFYHLFLNTALKPAGPPSNLLVGQPLRARSASGKMKVGTYNKMVKYPQSAYSLVHQLSSLPNTTKRQLVLDFGDGPDSVMQRILKTKPRVSIHTNHNKRFKSRRRVKKNALPIEIKNELNLKTIMQGYGRGQQAANKKKKSDHLKSYTHGNLISKTGVKPGSRYNLKSLLSKPIKSRFAPDPKFTPIGIHKKAPRTKYRIVQATTTTGARRARLPSRYRDPNMVMYL